jgi:hypothetical protein
VRVRVLTTGSVVGDATVPTDAKLAVGPAPDAIAMPPATSAAVSPNAISTADRLFIPNLRGLVCVPTRPR